MPRALRWSCGGGLFLMSEVPLHSIRTNGMRHSLLLVRRSLTPPLAPDTRAARRSRWGPPRSPHPGAREPRGRGRHAPSGPAPLALRPLGLAKTREGECGGAGGVPSSQAPNGEVIRRVKREGGGGSCRAAGGQTHRNSFGPSAAERDRKKINGFKYLRTDNSSSQGRNLALTGLFIIFRRSEAGFAIRVNAQRGTPVV